MSHSNFAAVIVALTGLALASPSLAQGRHDDKPHATAKPAPNSPGHPPPHTSGRHSDMMHGSSSMRAPQPRTEQQRPSGDAAAKPPADGANTDKPAEKAK